MTVVRFRCPDCGPQSAAPRQVTLYRHATGPAAVMPCPGCRAGILTRISPEVLVDLLAAGAGWAIGLSDMLLFTAALGERDDLAAAVIEEESA